jgi:hypothetical protein
MSAASATEFSPVLHGVRENDRCEDLPASRELLTKGSRALRISEAASMTERSLVSKLSCSDFSASECFPVCLVYWIQTTHGFLALNFEELPLVMVEPISSWPSQLWSQFRLGPEGSRLRDLTRRGRIPSLC